MPITALYAALLAPLFILLSARVIRIRRKSRVPIGDGGDAMLLRHMRVQANFAEYVPFALLLMALAEGLNTPAALLHALGIGLLAGRLLHAYGVSQARENYRLRVAGMVATLTVMGSAAITCLARALPALF